MRIRPSLLAALALVCGLPILMPVARADTFTNKKTGEVLTGSFVTRGQRDGKPVIFVRLPDGKSAFLDEEEWQVTATEPRPEPKKKGPGPTADLGCAASLAAVPLEDLAGARKVYIEHRAAIEKKYADSGTAAYRKSLTELEEQFVKRGNLEAVLALRREAERFERASSVPEDAVVKEPKELADLQREYRTRQQKVAALRDRECATLADLYVARLEEMKKHLTTQRKIDEALAVAAEIKQVRAGVSWVASPQPSAQKIVPLKLAKPCREADAILREVMNQMPEQFNNVEEVRLINLHDAASLAHHRGGPERAKDSFAKQALVGGGGGILMFGPDEKLPRGDYVIAYRFRFLGPVKGDSVCFVDVAADGATVSGSRPGADKFKPNAWTVIPQFLPNDRERSFHYRFWAHDHDVALDRIYVFMLVRKSS